MLFQSIQFVLFFLAVYAVYRVLPHKGQNRLLLLASYYFYGSWDWRFLSLILVTTIVDYVCGIKISSTDDRRTRLHFLRCSIGVNLGLLGVFKYFNFFSENLVGLLNILGLQANMSALNIVLPVGISFYTFQTLSYTIDIYYGKIKPTRNFWDFALFVAYFPQLVAGPIERAANLLPQITQPRTLKLEQFYQGCYLFFWGLFLKMFVADNLAQIVDRIFESSHAFQPSDALVAAYAFSFQIFGDFAGYSNMARGISKLLGIEIMNNFLAPFLAANPREFWRRWHISLSTWLRDYLYIPLGGNKANTFLTLRNLMITMLLGGLWHGASWVFVVWGLYHGVLLVIHRWMPKSETSTQPKSVRLLWQSLCIFVFFHFTCFGFLIFRSQSLKQLGEMIQAMLTGWNGMVVSSLMTQLREVLFFVFIVIFVQIIQYVENTELAMLKQRPIVRALFYVTLFYMIIIYGVTGGKEFIYFQF